MASAEYEDMFHHEDQLWWYRGLRDVLSSTVRRHSPCGGRLLDAGCGTGRNLQHYQDLGFAVTGVDLSAAALAFSRSRGVDSLGLASVAALPFQSSAFDVVSLMDVVSMLTPEERRRTFIESARLLRPGGLLLVNVCALDWLRSQHDAVVGVRKRFTASELRDEIRSVCLTGGERFEVLRCGYRVSLLLPIVAAIKLWKRATAGFRRQLNSDQAVTPGALNGPLTAVMKLESIIWERGIELPLGSSVYLVARKACVGQGAGD